MKKNLFLSAILGLLFCSCSGDDNPAPAPAIDNDSGGGERQEVLKNVKIDLASGDFVVATEADMKSPVYEKSYEALANGDYQITFAWPFQVAKLTLHHTEDFSFGDPEANVSFVKNDKTYLAIITFEIVYATHTTVKSIETSKTFTAVTP